ncbi:MAG: cytochrome c-type biogenesis protein CcmH [Gammaproteobacteria bacterium]|nr:MAG: cytochrome c-type biogenesis protein CcmH [Gammaproteobacteria bacterium]
MFGISINNNISNLKSNALGLVISTCLIFFSSSLLAGIQVFDFDDDDLAKRFSHLTSILRCPKCQNQNLTGSSSTLSQDLKQIVYEKLNAGESDQQILSFMKQRYGDFILFDPELSSDNALLWSGPLIFFSLILFLFMFWYKNNRIRTSELEDTSDLKITREAKND